MGEEQGYQYYDWIIDFLKLPVSKLDIWHNKKKRVVRPDRVGARQSLVRYSSIAGLVSTTTSGGWSGVHTPLWPLVGVPYIVRSYSGPVIREHPQRSLLPQHWESLNTQYNCSLFKMKISQSKCEKWDEENKVRYFDANNWSNVAPRTIENCFWQQHLFWLLLFSLIYLLWTTCKGLID